MKLILILMKLYLYINIVEGFISKPVKAKETS